MKLIFFCSLLFLSCAQPKLPPKESILESRCPASFAISQLCIQMEWKSMPSDSETGIFHFQILRRNTADDSFVLEDIAGDLSVELWMPSMGHGSSPIELERLSTGTYAAKEVFFTMHGEWEIRWSNKLADGSQDLATLPITY